LPAWAERPRFATRQHIFSSRRAFDAASYRDGYTQTIIAAKMSQEDVMVGISHTGSLLLPALDQFVVVDGDRLFLLVLDLELRGEAALGNRIGGSIKRSRT
jgi:hypothetical protein